MFFSCFSNKFSEIPIQPTVFSNTDLLTYCPHCTIFIIRSLYSPQVDITPTIKQFYMSNSQVGPFDYELFDLAYAFELGNSPEKILFDQPKMRLHF